MSATQPPRCEEAGLHDRVIQVNSGAPSLAQRRHISPGAMPRGPWTVGEAVREAMWLGKLGKRSCRPLREIQIGQSATQTQHAPPADQPPKRSPRMTPHWRTTSCRPSPTCSCGFPARVEPCGNVDRTMAVEPNRCKATIRYTVPAPEYRPSTDGALVHHASVVTAANA